MKILVGTNNAGKFTEISEILGDLPLKLLSPRDLSLRVFPKETGSTYEENAIIKARFYYSGTKLPSIADDSGIMIDALQGELGPKTRRWGAGAHASDEEWIQHFLLRMRDEENKRAKFLCTIAYCDNDGHCMTFDGVCEGTITDDLEAEYLPGLPISACFKPDGYDKVFSALGIEEKNRTSHRGKALTQFADFLRTSL